MYNLSTLADRVEKGGSGGMIPAKEERRADEEGEAPSRAAGKAQLCTEPACRGDRQMAHELMPPIAPETSNSSGANGGDNWAPQHWPSVGAPIGGHDGWKEGIERESREDWEEEHEGNGGVGLSGDNGGSEQAGRKMGADLTEGKGGGGGGERLGRERRVDPNGCGKVRVGLSGEAGRVENEEVP
ncbi:MAG: hypothetical protein M4579_001529 [Chaenotheca gracillima]|nr:MAG: hypothetical protein M4579_001529 [Chaenotheca gracillima]